MSTKLELLTPEEVKALEVSRQRQEHDPVCKCPTCGEVIPCERVHNGYCFVYHAVHCGWGYEVTPLENYGIQSMKALRTTVDWLADDVGEAADGLYCAALIIMRNRYSKDHDMWSNLENAAMLYDARKQADRNAVLLGREPKHPGQPDLRQSD